MMLRRALHWAAAPPPFVSSTVGNTARGLSCQFRTLAASSISTPGSGSYGGRRYDQRWDSRTRGRVGAVVGVAGSASLASVAQSEANANSNNAAAVVAPMVTLYQYNPCPFCNKVKAVLDYSGIPWQAVEVDPLFKAEMKQTGLKKVPVVQLERTEGYLADSDAIIDRLNVLAESLGSEHALPHAAPVGSTAAETEEQWRAWINGRFVHIVTANIYNTWSESVQTFDYLLTHGNFGKVNQLMSTYVGAGVMFALSKLKLNKKHGIENPRAELYADCNAWVDAVGDNRFLGNDDRPTLADLGIFGVLRAIQDYDTFDEVMANTKISSWYFRVAEAVGDSARIDPAQ